MPYCAPDDVRAVLTRDVSQPIGTAASLDDPELTEAISGAQQEVDAKLAVRYTVPFPDSNVPDLVVKLTRDIAAYLADLTYRQGKDYESDRDPVLLRYTRAQALLKDLSTGQADIEGPTPPTTSGALYGHQPFEGSMFGLDSFNLGYGGDRIRMDW